MRFHLREKKTMTARHGESKGQGEEERAAAVGERRGRESGQIGLVAIDGDQSNTLLANVRSEERPAGTSGAEGCAAASPCRGEHAASTAEEPGGVIVAVGMTGRWVGFLFNCSIDN